MTLDFSVNQQSIKLTSSAFPARYSKDFLFAHFTFSSEWKGEKTALFKHAGDTKSVAALLDESDTCVVPLDVLRDGQLLVSVYCVYGTTGGGNVRITSDIDKSIIVQDSLYGDDVVPPAPIPGTFEYTKSPAGNEAILYLRQRNGVFEYSKDGTTWVNPGDMLKSVYDPDGDGSVKTADTLKNMSASVAELNYIKGVTSTVQTQIDATNAKVADLQGYIGYDDSDIFGLEADFRNNTFTRLSGAIGKTAGASFDSVACFGGRKRCILTDSGVVLAYYGQTGYTETGKTTVAITVGGTTYPIGTIVQVMVEQPKFYYRIVPIVREPIVSGRGEHLRKARYYVSPHSKEGFKLHPAFIVNGIERERIYLSAYEGCIYDTSALSYLLADEQIADFAADKLSSIVSAKPCSGRTQSLTRANARRLAQNRGTGWQQSYGATIAATQLLFIIEYASFNTQTALGQGVVNKASGTGNESEITGATVNLGNNSGMAAGTNGLVSITYRGEENFWGNIYKWIDGFNIEAKGIHNLYVADNGFADNITTAPYQDAGITISKVSGYASAFAYNEPFDWLFMPSETIGSSSLPVGDYLHQDNTYNGFLVSRFGGNWADGFYAGGFYWGVINASTFASRNVSGRLVYVG